MISLLDMQEDLSSTRGVVFRIVAVDTNGPRREKMIAMVEKIYGGQQPENVVVIDPEAGKRIINDWTDSLGCNAVLEVSTMGSGIL